MLKRMGVIDLSSKKRLSLTRILHKYVKESNFENCLDLHMKLLCKYL